ncbi:aspartyl/asparaginyl beta-hydroxylase domain-containing protein [Roseivirga pacifica]|uniref:aspartyl/asparaginyl beta-hydroxylase domain-containing protein n=1 Tax=Roseivirga pacifica TaxID=1267423 RepID=UPI003BAD831C
MHTDRIKLPFQFDVERLLADLKTAEAKVDWISHFVKDNYEGDWSVIPLTAQKGRDHPILMASAIPGDKDFIPTPFLEACPYFQEVIDRFKTKYCSIRLMKLAVGSEIKEHKDFDLDLDEVRLHIPLITHADVAFYVNNDRVNMESGECWYLRLSDPHRVVNNSQIDRVHLVMDFELNDWLRELMTINRVSE